MSMTDAELQTLENLGHGDAAEEIRELRGDLAALRNDLSDALDCKNGTGPTALSLVIEERDSLRAELAACREREARMRGIGGQLSNAAFNLAQRAGHVISSDDCSLLDGLRKQWDAALAEGAQG